MFKTIAVALLAAAVQAQVAELDAKTGYGGSEMVVVHLIPDVLALGLYNAVNVGEDAENAADDKDELHGELHWLQNTVATDNNREMGFCIRKKGETGNVDCMQTRFSVDPAQSPAEL